MLQITSGAVDYQLIQRNRKGQGSLKLRGVCSPETSGVIEAQVRLSRGVVLSPHAVGEAAHGEWTAELRGIPTGGPYDITLRIAGTRDLVRLRHILVGDIWVLAGQSNMEGCGRLRDVEPPHPQVVSYSLAERWEQAADPLHWLLESPDSCHWNGLSDAERQAAAEEQRHTRQVGAGLGLTFAKELVKRTGVPVALLPCAHGGTTMNQWSPGSPEPLGASLYGSMLRRITAVGGTVRGILWYQGESDAMISGNERLFADRFRHLVQSIRDDVGDPMLPFLYVQLGRFAATLPSEIHDAWNMIQDIQRRSEAEIPGVRFAVAIDLSLDDQIHVGTQSLKRLGKRLSRLALKDVFHDETLQAGPRPAWARWENPERTVIRVHYTGVNGRLTAPGRLVGFVLRRADNSRVDSLFDQQVDLKTGCDVLLQIGEPQAEGCNLWYGQGCDPIVNLTDEKDMAAPVFGPMPVAEVS